CKLLAVGSPFFWQWEHPQPAVGTYTASGNSLLAVGMPCAFYSQQSFVTIMLNPTSDVGVKSIFTTASSPIVYLQTLTSIMTPSIIATITTSSEAPIPPPTIPSIILENLPTFNSAFCFEERLRSLETSFFEYRQTNPFVDAVSAIPSIVQQYMTQQITEAVREVKEQVSCILPRIEESVNATLEAEVLTRSSHSSRTSYAIAADLSEMELKRILIEKMEGNKSIQDSTILKRRREDDDQEGPSAGSNRGSKRQKERGEHASASTPSEKATEGAGRSTTGSQSRQMSANESAFAEEPVQTTCQMEEPPHLPRPLIPDNWGRSVIPFEHFINNDLEYLRGGDSSRKYTTSVTKTKAADYRHIKWIEDLVPRTIWIQEPISYDKHALWGVSHWRRKRQQFYGFAVNRESALNVYSKRRIIAVTELKIVEWHNYKHLDRISVRRDDDKIYKFKKGDFKRLRLQDIEDMLLLLVQGKLSNLTVDERFAFNVSLRMFTRSMVIQWCMEDLQLGVESYQKRLNLTKLDTYRSDLKRREAYTAYSNPR
nr:hypothetical protein [Tanacetum cinerariifolium]